MNMTMLDEFLDASSSSIGPWSSSSADPPHVGNSGAPSVLEPDQVSRNSLSYIQALLVRFGVLPGSGDPCDCVSAFKSDMI